MTDPTESQVVSIIEQLQMALIYGKTNLAPVSLKITEVQTKIKDTFFPLFIAVQADKRLIQ